MTTYNPLHTADQIQQKAKECAAWIDSKVSSESTYVLCPILQSGYQFCTDVGRHLKTNPTIDFFGVTNDDNGTIDELYIYKSIDIVAANNKQVIVLDVLTYSGITLDSTVKLIKQSGVRRVHTATLLYSQFSRTKPDWYGWRISDERVFGYGLDLNGQFRNLPYVAYI